MVGMGRIAILISIAAVVGAACSLGGGTSGQVNCSPLVEGLRSYRFSSTVRLVTEGVEEAADATPVPGVDVTIETRGEVVTPDRARSVTMYSEEIGGGDVSQIVIRDTKWTLVGNEWVSQRLGEGQPLAIPFLPAELCQGIAPDIDTAGVFGSTGKAGNIETKRFHFEDLQSDFISRLPSRQGGDDARYVKTLVVDIWLTDGHWPARLEVRGSGRYPDGRSISAEFIMQVTDPGDEEIEIEPPGVEGG